DPKSAALELYTDDDLSRIPPSPMLIDGVLPSNALALLFGTMDTGKTFTALDISAHVQLGLDEYHGRRVQRGDVVYISAEGRTGLQGRVAALKQFLGVPELGIHFLPESLVINEPAACERLLAAIDKSLGHRRVALVVIDTLNRNMTGNENSTEDM